jgi:hypothetical protein
LFACSIAAVFACVTVATAQPAPAPACGPCKRGDALIAQFSLESLRTIATELVTELGDPLTATEYGRLVERRQQMPALQRLGAIDDADLVAIATALCQAASGSCVETTARTLQCFAERCDVELPPTDRRRADILQIPEECHQYSTRKRTPQLGVGIETGTGWQRSRHPNDGRAWSFGIEGRARLGGRYGVVARIDRSKGRDVATDADDDGNDDIWTGSVTRITALAGPSIAFDQSRFEGTGRFLRLDLLGGYISTRSQVGESGPAAGADFSIQLSIVRLGARFVQGFGDARDASTALVHFGFLVGSAPVPNDPTDCGATPSSASSRLALALDTPMIGYAFSSDGLLTPGFGVEALWHLTPKLDAAARADLLYFPGIERERSIHQALLAGMRIDHGRRKRTGFFTTLLAGYSHAAGLPVTSSGFVGDLSLGWGIQADEGAAYFRLHGRFGITPDNEDYRVLFISAGLELRLDPKRWRDRT